MEKEKRLICVNHDGGSLDVTHVLSAAGLGGVNLKRGPRLNYRIGEQGMKELCTTSRRGRKHEVCF